MLGLSKKIFHLCEVYGLIWNLNFVSVSLLQRISLVSSGSVSSGIHHPSISLPNNVSVPLETQHASLKRKKEAPPPPMLYSPILEKSEVSRGILRERISCRELWWQILWVFLMSFLNMEIGVFYSPWQLPKNYIYIMYNWCFSNV